MAESVAEVVRMETGVRTGGWLGARFTCIAVNCICCCSKRLVCSCCRCILSESPRAEAPDAIKTIPIMMKNSPTMNPMIVTRKTSPNRRQNDTENYPDNAGHIEVKAFIRILQPVDGGNRAATNNVLPIVNGQHRFIGSISAKRPIYQSAAQQCRPAFIGKVERYLQ